VRFCASLSPTQGPWETCRGELRGGPSTGSKAAKPASPAHACASLRQARRRYR